MDFAKIVNRVMTLPGRTHMRPVIEKELLHYDILFILDSEGLLDILTFQGGTSLRLCYGSSRFSEDLDFAGGKKFAGYQLKKIKDCLERYIGQRYGLDVIVKEPRELRDKPEHQGLNVDKWQLIVVTAPGQRHMPKQRIKIEVANIPAYSRIPKTLQLNYDFLPDGYSDTLILTKTLDEILADKLVSLVSTSQYVRHRDIWDLRWLKQKGAKVNHEWVINKIEDYSIRDYDFKLENLWQHLPAIIKGNSFKSEISRFLPMDVQERTLLKEKFYDFLINEIRGLLDEVQQRSDNVMDSEFKM
ncbi:MAG: nucleotidyl transferase AbiEii/AbiGii toxin family protein [Thermodesulfobacteriota bacterium]|nr:nucleotidyl transferase AbiEii/AbiGii toxin family protein [Thermodesulfobacteriota bacterium]